MSGSKAERLKAQKSVAQNRRALHEYEILARYEAGIVLTGTEVKSLRLGQASIQEAFAGDKGGEIHLFNAYIPEYAQAGLHLQHETRRPRLLLLHQREIDKLLGGVRREGMTIVPLALFFNARGKAKVELGLAKGRNKGDKRAALKEKDWERDKARLRRGQKSEI
ncbi:MAG: SsrA-binding protein SmpB [Alphaproteobacteria bacterium]